MVVHHLLLVRQKIFSCRHQVPVFMQLPPGAKQVALAPDGNLLVIANSSATGAGPAEGTECIQHLHRLPVVSIEQTAVGDGRFAVAVPTTNYTTRTDHYGGGGGGGPSSSTTNYTTTNYGGGTTNYGGGATGGGGTTYYGGHGATNDHFFNQHVTDYQQNLQKILISHRAQFESALKTSKGAGKPQNPKGVSGAKPYNKNGGKNVPQYDGHYNGKKAGKNAPQYDGHYSGKKAGKNAPQYDGNYRKGGKPELDDRQENAFIQELQSAIRKTFGSQEAGVDRRECGENQ